MESAESLSKKVFDAPITKPRIVRRQVHRQNPEVSNPEEYYRITAFRPGISILLEELKTRFALNSQTLTSFQIFMPGFAGIDKMSSFKNLSMYYNEWCAETIIETEYRNWCEIVKNLNYNLDVIEVMNNCNSNLFPNVYRLLKILATIPVTTCSAERSFSTMKRVKNYLRNRTGHERLSSLILLSVHHTLHPNAETIFNLMFAKKSRRI